MMAMWLKWETTRSIGSRTIELVPVAAAAAVELLDPAGRPQRVQVGRGGVEILEPELGRLGALWEPAKVERRALAVPL